MALNFPPNPSPGAKWTVGNKTYTWSGKAWLVTNSPIVTTSATITDTTKAVSTTTGALTVAGGVGIQGDLYVGGSIISSSINTGTAVVSDTGTFKKVLITGGIQATSTTSGDLIVAGGVGIGGDLYIGGVLYSGGVPVLTTASFNNTAQDGQDIDIVDLGGGILQFNNISTLQSTTNRGSTTSNAVNITNTTSATSTTTGALTVAGGVGIGGRVHAESLRIADVIFDSSVRTINTTTDVVIDSFNLNEYRSAKYLIQIDEGSGAGSRCQMTELAILPTHTGTVHIAEFGSVMSDTDLAEFDADIINVGGNPVVTLYILATDDITKTVTVLRTAMVA
jgi:hypothetical protein